MACAAGFPASRPETGSRAVFAAQSGRIGAPSQTSMLFLLFSCGGARYGLEAGEVAVVLALRRLQPNAQAPALRQA